MNLTEFLWKLKEAGENIVEGFGEGGETTNKIFKALEEQEEKIFERQEGPQSEWPEITTISYITRKEVNDTYSSPENLIADAKNAQILRDKGELFRQATGKSDDKVRRVKIDGKDYQLVFGTTKGYKHQKGGEPASGISDEMKQRALNRVEDEAYGMVKQLLDNYEGSQGEIPQRQFLYITDEGFNKSFEIAFDDMVNSLEEALKR